MDRRIELAALTGRMMFQIGRERVARPRPVALREVPPSPEHLTDEWLTLALCDESLGAKVTGHELGPPNNGTSSRRALRVAYDAPGQEAGLPEHLFTKSSPTLTTRLVSAAAALGRIEATFYDRIRPGLEIEAPATRYSAFDPVTYRQLLIVDDVTITRGASFATILERVLTREQAEQVVDTLASLHATFWGKPITRWFGSWLPDAYEWMNTLNVTIGAPQRSSVGFARSEAVMPPEVHRRAPDYHRLLMRSLELNLRGPQTVLHGDVHPGNWYVTREGRMGLYDWQCMVRGGWSRDLAYALSTHLTVDDRRAWERELVARYVERLAEAGIGPPDPERAFLSYRQGMLHAMWMWIGTIGRHRLQPDMQPHDVTLETVRRASQAAADLDSFAAVSRANVEG